MALLLNYKAQQIKQIAKGICSNIHGAGKKTLEV